MQGSVCSKSLTHTHTQTHTQQTLFLKYSLPFLSQIVLPHHSLPVFLPVCLAVLLCIALAFVISLSEWLARLPVAAETVLCFMVHSVCVCVSCAESRAAERNMPAMQREAAEHSEVKPSASAGRERDQAVSHLRSARPVMESRLRSRNRCVSMKRAHSASLPQCFEKRHTCRWAAEGIFTYAAVDVVLNLIWQ